MWRNGLDHQNLLRRYAFKLKSLLSVPLYDAVELLGPAFLCTSAYAASCPRPFKPLVAWDVRQYIEQDAFSHAENQAVHLSRQRANIRRGTNTEGTNGFRWTDSATTFLHHRQKPQSTLESPNHRNLLPRRDNLRQKTKCLRQDYQAAGSSTVFFVMLAIILAWVILGIVYGTTDTWQILMQNGSSIQVYISDILLIRQQQNAARVLMTAMAEIQSRGNTCERLLRQIPDCQWMETHKEAPKQLTVNGRLIDDEVEESLYMATGRPSRFQYVWSKMCHGTAKALGSLYAYIFYWIGIFAWVGIGELFSFSNTWQLYVNTATAVALTFTSVFLQNIQQQQEDKLESCLQYALKIDAEVEHRLRELTSDSKPNPIFEIAPRKRDWIERSIDGFADIMGSGVGVVLSLTVTIVWIAVGPTLEFSDNWWLIIGTFTGLVGFIDGFILRNMYYREEQDVNKQFQAVSFADRKLLDLLNVHIAERLPGIEPQL
ncbi:hypothetical protein G7Y89_g13523 [Cudoniella acicularis]|uniref:Uncharacterized protein n=1 Tax=Cudoniella acicularis TaxID=354080 RepID=A0A8H4R798_9HELO|nr:hypothetical protein G7Y89_g13523 [Cudoniella acicularis]